MTIADKAKEIIYGDREQTYGDPRKNLDCIAELWTSYMKDKAEITADDVCNMMCLLKIARLKNTPAHEDSMTDIVGYTLLQERINAHNTEQDKSSRFGVRQGMECSLSILGEDASGRPDLIDTSDTQCIRFNASYQVPESSRVCGSGEAYFPKFP